MANTSPHPDRKKIKEHNPKNLYLSYFTFNFIHVYGSWDLILLIFAASNFQFFFRSLTIQILTTLYILFARIKHLKYDIQWNGFIPSRWYTRHGGECVFLRCAAMFATKIYYVWKHNLITMYVLSFSTEMKTKCELYVRNLFFASSQNTHKESVCVQNLV